MNDQILPATPDVATGSILPSSDPFSAISPFALKSPETQFKADITGTPPFLDLVALQP